MQSCNQYATVNAAAFGIFFSPSANKVAHITCATTLPGRSGMMGVSVCAAVLASAQSTKLLAGAHLRVSRSVTARHSLAQRLAAVASDNGGFHSITQLLPSN